MNFKDSSEKNMLIKVLKRGEKEIFMNFPILTVKLDRENNFIYYEMANCNSKKRKNYVLTFKKGW